MSAEDRRELVLEAATRAFARGGYAGTSTDAVAKEAGVSQPYVVRIFGTKLRALPRGLRARLRAGSGRRSRRCSPTARSTPTSEDDWARLGLAYTELLRDRDLLLVMMHGFAGGQRRRDRGRAAPGMGADLRHRPVAPAAPTSAPQDFVAQGMLLNVMLSMRAPEHLERGPRLTALATCAFGDALNSSSPRDAPSSSPPSPPPGWRRCAPLASSRS